MPEQDLLTPEHTIACLAGDGDVPCDCAECTCGAPHTSGVPPLCPVHHTRAIIERRSGVCPVTAGFRLTCPGCISGLHVAASEVSKYIESANEGDMGPLSWLTKRIVTATVGR